MKRNMTMTITMTVVILVLFLFGNAVAQSEGDYRSAASGDWSDAATWETFVGASWVDAVSAPGGADDVTIRDGHVIELDVALVVSGSITVEGEGVGQGGSLQTGGTGSLAFDGGTYVHDRDGGSIPAADWQDGSTIVFSGIISSGPGNRTQAYHNLTWNNPDQSSNMNMGWGEVTLGGSIHVISTGSARLHMTDAGNGDGNTITILGDVIAEGGQLSTTGSGGAAVYTVVVMGNVEVHDGANLAPSRGSGGHATWNLHGDFTVSNGATLQDSHTGNLGTFAFVAEFTDESQKVHIGDGVNYSGTLNFLVAEEAVVEVESGSQFYLEDFLVVEGVLNVGGELINAGSIDMSEGEITVHDGGVYEHARDGGSVPVANWEDGSTVLFSGIIGSGPGNRNQEFYNVTWNNPGQTSNINMGWGEVTLGGTIHVISSGSARFQLTDAGSGDGNTITILGDVIAEGGQLATTGSSGAAVYTVEVMGNVEVHEGANLSPSRGSGGHATWLLHGSFTVTGGTLQDSHEGGLGTFAFVADTTGGATQAVHVTRETSYTGTINFAVPASAVIEVIDETEFYVEGNLVNSGTVLTSGSGQVVIGDGGVYEHARNGGAIPDTEWLAGSTVLITGITDENAANSNQNYHNIVLNTPGLATRGNLMLHNVTISGDIHVVNTANDRWYLTVAPAGGEAIFTIKGDVMVDAGTFTVHGSGNSQTTYEVHHYGNIHVGAGAANFSITRGSQGGNGTTRWYLYEGDFTMLGGTTQSSNARSGSNFVFAGEDVIQNLTVTNNVNISHLPVEIMDGAHLNLGQSEIGGNDQFILHEGGTMGTAHADGFDANIQTDAPVLIAQNATFIFIGEERQQTSFRLPATVQNLVIDNEAGVDQTRNITVTGTLSLLRGEFNNQFTLTMGEDAQIVQVDGFLRHPLEGVTHQTVLAESASDQPLFSDFFRVVENEEEVYTYIEALVDAPAQGTAPEDGHLTFNTTLTGEINIWLLVNMPDPDSDSFFIRYDDHDMVRWWFNYEDHGEDYGAWVWARYEDVTTDSPPAFEATGDNDLVLTRRQAGARLDRILFTTDLNYVPEDPDRERIVTDAEEDHLAEIPMETALHQNYPNPFNPVTNIEYDLHHDQHVRIEVYNAIGQLVAVLVDSHQSAGTHTVSFGNTSLPSGMYLYRMQTDHITETRKMMLLK